MHRHLFLIVLSVISLSGFAADESPSLIRIITFNGENLWQATETIYSPTEDGRYRTLSVSSLIKQSTSSCDDILSSHQRRALDVMLENNYITHEMYEFLLDSTLRAHGLRQYILATSFIELTRDQIQRQNIQKGRLLEQTESGYRVHRGSLFVVRDYDLERKGPDDDEVVKSQLPWEVGDVPPGLRGLDHSRLSGSLELGRALIEEGAPKGEFHRLLHLLISAVSADARILGLDPSRFAVFGHALDAQHSRLFSLGFPMRPMTTAMQDQLEQDPAEFLKSYLKIPLPTREGWQSFSNSVVVGSLAEFQRVFPPAKLSEFVYKFKSVFPSSASDEDYMAAVRELAVVFREDFDYHSEDGRGIQGQPIQVRDFGTGLLKIKFLHILDQLQIPRSIDNFFKVFELIKSAKLFFDMDFHHDEWLENSYYVPIPTGSTQSDAMLPAMTISNLDPTVPTEKLPEYLGRILLSVSEKINAKLAHLSLEDFHILLNDMLQTRTSRGLGEFEGTSLPAFLEIYDLNFAASSPALRWELAILGGLPVSAMRIHGGASQNQKIKFDIDADEIGISLEAMAKDPALRHEFESRVLAKAAQFFSQTFIADRVYRFRFGEVADQRIEVQSFHYGQMDQILRSSFHRKKLLRHCITYQ